MVAQSYKYKVTRQSDELINNSHGAIIPYSSQQSKTTNNLITTITDQKPVRAFIFALDSLA